MKPEQMQQLKELGAYLHRVRHTHTPVLSFPEIRRRGGPAVGWLGELEGGSMRSFPKRSSLLKLAKGLGRPYREVLEAAGELDVSGPPIAHERPTGKNAFLPVFDVACGEPLIIPEHADEYEEWDISLIRGANAIMRVRGTSMLGCGFKPGDHLFVQYINGVKPNHGDKVIAVIDGGVTCKFYRNDDLGEYLESAPEEGESWRKPLSAAVRLVAIVRRRLTDE